jgi:hypothetical protein
LSGESNKERAGERKRWREISRERGEMEIERGVVDRNRERREIRERDQESEEDT